jgi:hypothetical protein
MAAFCSAENFLGCLVVGSLAESGSVSRNVKIQRTKEVSQTFATGTGEPQFDAGYGLYRHESPGSIGLKRVYLNIPSNSAIGYPTRDEHGISNKKRQNCHLECHVFGLSTLYFPNRVDVAGSR